MKVSRTDLLVSLLLLIVAGIAVFDLFLTPGRPASFDSPFHITMLTQFYLGLKNGDLPVVWNDGVANYGLPLSIVAHQLTNYLGAILLFLTHNPVLSYNILWFLGIFFSSLFFYVFLRIYFSPIASFCSTYLFSFTSYKLINFYVRGAMPEVFSGMFLSLILIGMYVFIKRKNILGLYLLSFSMFLLTLNHPMMLFIYAFIYGPYLLFLLLTKNDKFDFALIKKKETLIYFVLPFIGMAIGVGMGSYYLLPLNFEIKYFYYGQTSNHLTPNNYLSLWNYLTYDWQYFTPHEIFTRGHIIQTGVLETLAVILGLLFIIWKLFIKKEKSFTILEFAVLVSFLIMLFTFSATNIFYTHLSILSNIQFPWRMLSAFIFLPPIIYAYFFARIKFIPILLGFILLVSLLRFPQMYGKNYVDYPIDSYYFTPYNVHSVLMNTIWSGKSEDYPIKRDKPEIVEGNGTITEKTIKNSKRSYIIDAKTPIRLVDYTFYFPGWKVYVDGNPVPIEFQDPKYRGVITYNVPQGEHNVLLKFEATKIRFFGKMLTIFFAGLFVIGFFLRKRLALYLA